MAKAPGAVRFCGDPYDAISLAVKSRDAIAVLLDADGVVTVASMTWLGPSVWSPTRAEGVPAAADAVRDTSLKGKEAFLYVEDRGVFDAVRARLKAAKVETFVDFGRGNKISVQDALAAFRKLRPEPSTHLVAGEERATTWSVAPIVEGDAVFEIGNVFRLAAEPSGAGVVLRWRGDGGRDCGIYVVLDRPMDVKEEALVQRSTANVTRYSYGLMPSGDENGTVRICTLMLDAPADLVRAFPDGRLPRHGVVKGS